MALTGVPETVRLSTPECGSHHPKTVEPWTAAYDRHALPNAVCRDDGHLGNLFPVNVPDAAQCARVSLDLFTLPQSRAPSERRHHLDFSRANSTAHPRSEYNGTSSY
jgi:hypothetical protein